MDMASVTDSSNDLLSCRVAKSGREWRLVRLFWSASSSRTLHRHGADIARETLLRDVTLASRSREGDCRILWFGRGRRRVWGHTACQRHRHRQLVIGGAAQRECLLDEAKNFLSSVISRKADISVMPLSFRDRGPPGKLEGNKTLQETSRLPEASQGTL